MARGGRQKGGRGGRQTGEQGGGRAARQSSGIEKYGQDEVDEFLNLDADEDEATENESDVCDEEEVMAIEPADEDEPEDWSPPKRAPQVASLTEDSDEEGKLEPATKGWRRNEFYGGEDGGDASGEDSDEDIVFQEAKRLEELRARQLTGEEDVLAALLATPMDSAASTEALVEPGPVGASMNAHFDSIFTGEAEKVSSTRDLSELPAGERRGILKKEAPELMPLLNDFKAKLSAYRDLLPLLQPHVLRRLSASGAAYLETKAGLLLNNLANLSFYLLLRAEGGAVRAHPVIPQLVWLRELHEQLAPLEKNLGKKMRKAVVFAKQANASAEPSLKTEGLSERSTVGMLSSSQKQDEEGLKVSKKKTLRERLQRMQLQQSTIAPAVGQPGVTKQGREPVAGAVLTKDLLRLPKARQTGGTRSAYGPLDLDDVDPTLGVWAPRSSLGEQVSAIEQQMREHATRAKAATVSADQETEARPRRARQRDRTPMHPEPTEIQQGPSADNDDNEEEDDLIKTALSVAKSKKEKRNQAETARAEAKEEARRLREFHPEEVQDGRRKTSKKILNNRGLHRVRKAKSGNARVANKQKYEKSVKRRKGAVQEMREGADDGATYEGEATGVRTHVRKSLKIG